MDRDFLEQVASRVDEIRTHNKRTIFTIATTTKQEKEAYLTPVRNNNDFCLTGCIIFNQKIILPLLDKIDGMVDIILVDSEKKIPIRVYAELEEEVVNTVGYVETGSISKICFKNVKYSKVFEFKPNDLTVNATWLFLSQKFNFLSGKRISILGAGNIGSKLALKLVECGADVHLYRRDSYKGYNITHGLNFIKPTNTVANIQFHQDIVQASFMSDVIIGATDGCSIINEDVINSLKKNCLIVDLGKNNLTKGAIKVVVQKSLEIYRADVTPTLEAYVYEVLKMQDILENSYGRKNIGFCHIVGGGFFGHEGDIIVNQIDNPNQIIGISNGDGSIKKDVNDVDQCNIDRINMEYGIE